MPSPPRAQPPAERVPARVRPAPAAVPVARIGPAAVEEPGRRRPAPRRPFWRPLLPVLVLLVAATRLPSLTRPVWNPDEGFLATQARQLASGGRLYDTVVDRKPPLVPWLYEGAFALFGDRSLWPLRAAAMAAVLAGAVLLASLARRRWGRRAGWTAGVLHVLVSIGLVPEDAQAATFEVFMVPWTVAACWCAGRGRWGLAGLAVAGAALSKQTGGAVLLPVLFVLWRARAGRWACARLLVSLAVPVLAVAVAFGPGRFAYWLATGSSAYVSVAGARRHAVLRAVANGGVLALACAPFLAALLRPRRGLPWRGRGRGRSPARGEGTADVWVWLAASCLATAVGFQFYGHYFLQLTPPLALLGAVALDRLAVRGAVTAVALTGLLAAGFTGWGLTAPTGELDHARRVAAAVRARTAPGERVLVWGMHPEDYWLARRAPASRYLTAGFLTNYSGGRGPGVRVGERYAMAGAWPYFRRELVRDPPALVVDDARGKPYAARRTPTLRAYLDRYYVPAGSVDGALLYVPAPRPARGHEGVAARSGPVHDARHVRPPRHRGQPRTSGRG